MGVLWIVAPLDYRGGSRMPFGIEDAKDGESKGSAKASILVGFFMLLATPAIQPLQCCSITLATYSKEWVLPMLLVLPVR